MKAREIMDEADRAKHFVNPADVGGQIHNSGTSSQNQQTKQGITSNLKYPLPDLSGVSISEKKPQSGPKLMLNFDSQQNQQQPPQIQQQQASSASLPVQTQQQQTPIASNTQVQAQESAQWHNPQNYQVQGQQIIPASFRPENVAYHEEFIKNMSPGLANSVIEAANNLGYRFNPVSNLKYSEAHQNEIMNAMYALDHYKSLMPANFQKDPLNLAKNVKIANNPPVEKTKLPAIESLLENPNQTPSNIDQSTSQHPTPQNTDARLLASMTDNSMQVHLERKEAEKSSKRQAETSSTQEPVPKRSKRDRKPVDRLQVVGDVKEEDDGDETDSSVGAKKLKKNKKG